ASQHRYRPAAAAGDRGGVAAYRAGGPRERDQTRGREPGRAHTVLHGRCGDAGRARRRYRLRSGRGGRGPGGRRVRADRDAGTVAPHRGYARGRVLAGRRDRSLRLRAARERCMSIGLVIVDDHPVVRDGLRGMFAADSSFVVLGEAADGTEALAVVAAVAPDVVLMDLRMPGMDGVTAIRALR